MHMKPDSKRVARILFCISVVLPILLQANPWSALSQQEQERIDAGEIVVHEVPNAARPGRTFEAFGRFNASRVHLMEVLTRYELYPEFMPNVSRITILEEQDAESTLEYELSLPLGKTKQYRLKMSISEPDAHSTRLQWQQVPWPGLNARETIKDTTGYWHIQEISPDRSLVKYHVYTDPGPIPFGLGWIVDLLSKESVPKTLLQTRMRAEEAKNE